MTLEASLVEFDEEVLEYLGVFGESFEDAIPRASTLVKNSKSRLFEIHAMHLGERICKLWGVLRFFILGSGLGLS